MLTRKRLFIVTLLFAITLPACGFKKAEQKSELDNEDTVQVETTPLDVAGDAAAGSGTSSNPAGTTDQTPTTAPTSTQTLPGDKAAADKETKTEVALAKIKDWWREMVEYVRNIGEEKKLKDQTKDELLENLEKSKVAHHSGDPTAMFDIRNIVTELVLRKDPTAKVIGISSGADTDDQVTDSFLLRNQSELDMEGSLSQSAGGGVDVPGLKAQEEIRVDAKTGTKFLLEGKVTRTVTHRESRVVVRVMTTNEDGSMYHQDHYYLHSGKRITSSRTVLDYFGENPLSLMAANPDRPDRCNCASCRLPEKLPEGYHCAEFSTCNESMCAKWKPIPAKKVFIKAWYYPGTKKLLRVVPAYEAADRELELVVNPTVTSRTASLSAAVKNLENTYQAIAPMNAKSKNLLASVERFVKSPSITKLEAQNIERQVQSHSIAACSAPNMAPLIAEVRVFDQSIDVIKPDFDRVVNTLVEAGEDRVTLESNWEKWTKPFDGLKSRVAIIEAEISINYIAKVQAAIEAIGLRLDQEKINGINTDLIAIVDQLNSALDSSLNGMLFVALRERYAFESLSLSNKLNRARLKRQFARGQQLSAELAAWNLAMEATISESKLSPDRKLEIISGSRSLTDRRIKEWQEMVASSGQEGILNRRIFKLGRKLPKVLAAIQAAPKVRHSELLATWREHVSRIGFEVPAQCFLEEHETQDYCWKLERSDSTTSMDVYDQRLDGLDHQMDSFMIELTK